MLSRWTRIQRHTHTYWHTSKSNFDLVTVYCAVENTYTFTESYHIQFNIQLSSHQHVRRVSNFATPYEDKPMKFLYIHLRNYVVFKVLNALT